MKNFIISFFVTILMGYVLWWGAYAIQYNYNPVNIGDVYTEEISDNPFSTDIPDTVTVLDIKNGYVKYHVVYNRRSGLKGDYISSAKIIPFKLYYTKMGEIK